MKKAVYMGLPTVLVLAVLLYFASFYFRYHQFQVWKAHPKVYFVDNYPAMTTLDAYFWLRYAKEYKNGTYYKSDNDTLRAYPTNTVKPHPVPLLSAMISWFSSISGKSIYMSGLILVSVLAGLFILPMVYYFWLADMPIAGLTGAFVGAFSWMYAIRTAMGRVDTDLLQLFFMFSGSLLILLASETKSNRNRLIYSALLGLNFLLFGWWYAHYGIDVVYLALFIIMLLIRKVELKQIVIATLLFIIFANPVLVIKGFGGVVSFFGKYGEVKAVSTGNFPNIMKTITETEHISPSKVIVYILSNKLLDGVGLILSLGMLFALGLRVIPILPIVLLGFLAFKSSNRTVMFLAPFVGAGLGFVVDMIFHRLNFDNLKANVASFFVTVILMVALLHTTAYKFVPLPSIQAPIVRSFLQIKNRINKAAIFSWWDYGYAIEDMDGFATYHDGGAHGGARTYLVAKALISDNETLLYHIISFMDSYGVKPIMDAIEKDNISAGKAVQMAFDYSKPIKNNDNYVLFTEDMIGKFYAISYLGSWDFKKEKSYPDGYAMYYCSGFENGTFTCDKGFVDIVHGYINSKIPIKRFLWVVNGRVKKDVDLHPNGVNVELCLTKRPNSNQLDVDFMLVCDDRVFNSNFNRMFILGEIDKDKFEEVYNNFPYARMFRVK